MSRLISDMHATRQKGQIKRTASSCQSRRVRRHQLVIRFANQCLQICVRNSLKYIQKCDMSLIDKTEP